ncbi:MAG: serine/threonine-protein kinase [Rudaea sp.]
MSETSSAKQETSAHAEGKVGDGPANASRTRVRELFDQIVEIPAQQADDMLSHADLSVEERAAVMRLLDGHRKHRLFGVPAANWAHQLQDNDDAAESLLGRRIGPFEIARFIGRGGSAVVFLARRSIGDANQDVALKVLNNGRFSSDALRRFQREQSILSRLTHPNIARLIDAGIDDVGSPFIAMEFVEGVDLIRYAATHSLDLRARLHLLIDLCRAVDAAHRLLIVHRDLKPSNVLVTADGQIKVLDFGIAKLVDDTDLETATQHIALTPAYAAPEQFHAGPAATSMDVFALGVLSSELLLGGRLGADATLPTNDSTKTWPRWRKLDTDLAHILRAALASEPRRRYSSAGHMADDFERYLRREPIQVVPLSQGYRLRKFISRHRRGVAATSLVLATALAGAVGVLYQAGVAQRQAKIAQQQAVLAQEHAARANEVRDFLVSVFKAGSADLPRDQRPSVDDIVEKASQRLLSDQHLADGLRMDLLLTLAEVSSSIGAYARAETLLDEIDLLAARVGDNGRDALLRSSVLRAGNILAQTATRQGERVVSILEPLRGTLESRSEATAIQGLLHLANGYEYEGRTEEALGLARSAVSHARSTKNPELLLNAMERQASLTCETMHHVEAIHAYDAAMAVWESQGRPALPVVINLFGGTAIAKEAAGDISGAEIAYRRAIDESDRFYDRDNVTTMNWLHFYGLFLIAQSRADEAEPYLRRALQITEGLYGANDTRTLQSVSAMASLAAARGNSADAIQWATRAIDLSVAQGVGGLSLAGKLGIRARFEAEAGRLTEASSDVERALTEQRKNETDDSPFHASILNVRLDIQVRQHRYQDAVDTADQVLAINRPVGGSSKRSELITRFLRAKALLGLRRTSEALAELQDVEPEYAKINPNDAIHFEMATLKADALVQARRPAEASVAAHVALALAPTSADRNSLTHLRRLSNSSPQR